MKNLNYVTSLVKMDLDDFSSSRDQKYLQYAIMGFRDLNLHTMPNIKVAYLQPNDAMVAPLPDDYEYYTKIGMCIAGQVWTLSVNRDLCMHHNLDTCGLPIDEVSKVNLNEVDQIGIYGRYQFSPHFRHGQYVGEMYGLGGGFNDLGYYRIDHEMHLIQFSSLLPKSEIVLEYKSNGADRGGESLIPGMCVEAIRAYVHWQLAEHDRTYSDSSKERKRGLFRDEHSKLRDLVFSFTMDEYLDSTYQAIKSTVKR